jgi:putative sigma-54 modulation protein
MNVSITGRKVKITPQIRSYIEKNMKKLDHYIDHIYDFKLILKRERHIYFAEVNINVKRKIIHIFAKTEDAYGVLDILFDKIEEKLHRYRDKITNKRVMPLKESGAAIGLMGGQKEGPKELEETAS